MINSDEKQDQKSVNSNVSAANQFVGYSNPAMSGCDENDVLVNNNNYGTINGSHLLVRNKNHIDISRDVIDFNDLYHKYRKKSISEQSLCPRVRQSANNCYKSCSVWALIVRLLPILSWMRTYSIKQYLLSDVVAGFTILVLHIPQGMAYGMLAGLSPINGLYVSFFPVLIYSLMGTSRHISTGK